MIWVTDSQHSWLRTLIHVSSEIWGHLGPVSISDKTSYLAKSRKISKLRNSYLELSNRFEIWKAHRQHSRWFRLTISRLQGFRISHDKTSSRILKRGPVGFLAAVQPTWFHGRFRDCQCTHRSGKFSKKKRPFSDFSQVWDLMGLLPDS